MSSWSTRVTDSVNPVSGDAHSNVWGVQQYETLTFYINNTTDVSVDIQVEGDPDNENFDNDHTISDTSTTVASGAKDVIALNSHHHYVRIEINASSADSDDTVDIVGLFEHKNQG